MPSKGFEWAIARASNPETSFLTDRDWSEAGEIPSRDFFSRTPYSECKDGTLWISNGDNQFHVHFNFDPDANFTYFTSASEINDSTYFFAMNMMENLAFKVCTLQTADKTKIENGVDFTDVFWTIGNFVFLTETDDKFAPEGKPWMKTRMTALLPLRMDVR